MNCTAEMLRLYAVTDRAWVGEQTLRQSVDQRLFHTFFLCCLQIFLILGKDQLLLHDQLVCHCAKSFIFLRCSQFCRCDSRMFCMVCKHFHI